MGAIAPFTLPDGKATPENHTFNPIQSAPPVFKENGDDTVPTLGESTVTVKLVKATGNGSVDKALVNMTIPVLETPTGGTPQGYVAPPQVAYTLRAKIEFILPQRSTGAQRKDLRVMMENLLAGGALVDLVDELEMPY